MRTSFTSIAAIAGLFALASAVPAYFGDGLVERQATLVCASGTPQCCDVDVLGVADLDCANRKDPASVSPKYFTDMTLPQLLRSQQLLTTSLPFALISARLIGAAFSPL